MNAQQPSDSQPLPGYAKQLQDGDPSVVGHYEVIGRLGAGGMGAVYLARSAAGQQVAVKVIRPALAQDEGFRTRFNTEVSNAERVASFCTAQVLDHGTVDGLPYLVTEFIEGPTLARHVTRHGALSPGTLHGMAVGVAAGLTAIHAAGLVHRDLKPANVILSVSGPRVIDFGIAQALDAAVSLTPTGQLIGSPGWMAPEQLLNHPVTTAADIFAWGCLVAYAGKAAHPYGRGDALALAARILHGDPDIEGLPRPLLDLVGAALNQDPEQRPTAQHLLLTLVGGTPQSVDAKTTQIIEKTWQVPQEPPTAPDATAAPDTAPDRASALPPTTPVAPSPAPGGPGGQGWPSGGQEMPTAAPSRDVTAMSGEQPVPTVAGGHATLPAPPELAPTQPPGARSAARKRTYLLAGAGVAVVGVVAAAFVLFNGKQGTDGKTPQSAFTPVALSGVSQPGGGQPSGGHPGGTDIGRPVTASSIEFTVGRPKCGAPTFQALTAKGRFCLVPLTIRNVAPPGSGRTGRIPRDRQQLIDSRGTTYKSVELPDGFLNAEPEIAPGGRIAGELLFDLTKDVQPVRLELFPTRTAKAVVVWI